MDHTADTIIGIFADQMGTDAGSISRATRLAEDLDIDSLDGVELRMKIEDRFGISIPDADVEHMRTVGDVIDFLSGPGETGVFSKLKPPPQSPGERA